jgi:hypothetical protein
MLLDVGLQCSWMFVGGETKLLSESLFRLETRQAREDFFYPVAVASHGKDRIILN